MKINIDHPFLAVFTASLLSIGCAAPKTTAIKQAALLPEQYTAVAGDSLSVARLQFRDFFSDKPLVTLIGKVLDNNIDGQIAAAQIKIAEAYLEARKTALLPSVTAGLRASGTHYGKHTMEGVGNFDTNLSPNIDRSQRIPTVITPDYWLGLSASWEIDLWGKLGNLQHAARERFLATRQGRDLLTAALITHTATLYYELIMLDKEVGTLNENIALQDRALEIVKIHKEVGRATELAVQQFDAQLANTRAALYGVQQEITATENQLLELSGNYTGTIERSASIDISALRYLAEHGQPQQLLQYRPDIRAAYHELQASHADAKAARAAFFPAVNLAVSAGPQAFNAAKLFNPTSLAAQLLGGITAPVFQKKQLNAHFNIATAEQEIAFLNYQKIINKAFQEVKTLLSYIDQNEKIRAEKNREVAALDKGIEVSNDLYVTAYATYLEIIAAQKSKITADLDLIKAERNQAHVLIQLYKALGGGAG
ncbi:TolC family protein [Niabella drilacis]|uniref:Efflux transporter, outer membrane factor (OMF) lipoprotein, NodT family n=1 Tax=Niabella drilacis (strain DSM 25811 / CCM 8410 / CCUG 62505 / LMG 26954 / E90) TaxID=1285928 RepID=A0A1G6HXV6_NIADE|nr:TolC family protein [Niabella drilacis]SDB99051.1 efflux transporter, outer membrane factor (OMF) lipoprotein, NodT family [Niabella drilacis]